MLNIKLCKKVLNKNGNKYSDDQVEDIMEFVSMLAEIYVNNQKDIDHGKERSHIHQSVNRHSG